MRRIKVSEAEKHNRQRSEDLRRYGARIWKGVYYFPSYSTRTLPGDPIPTIPNVSRTPAYLAPP
jgi:hypothetical protein